VREDHSADDDEDDAGVEQLRRRLGRRFGGDVIGTMVSLIDQLESAGLAKRRTHPKDRRAREVSITPKGRQMLERARGLATRVEEDVLRGLSAAERRQLLTLLRRALSSAPPQPLWRAEDEKHFHGEVRSD
jgi:DNA-binding PadR family transcriptional regulator